MSDDIDTMMARYEGNFVEAADLMGVSPVLTISSISAPGTEKAADGRVIDKPIITFSGARKRLILGKTNIQIIAAMHGKKPSGWVGKQIKLGVRYLREVVVPFRATNVPTVRVIPPPEVEGTLPLKARKWMGSERPYPSKEDRT